MTTPRETLRESEHLHEELSPNEHFPDALTPVQVEELHTKRIALFESITGRIGTLLRDAIAAKIRYEREFLLDLIAREQTQHTARAKRNKTLPSEYFVQIPLEHHL